MSKLKHEMTEAEATFWSALHDICYIGEPRSSIIAEQLLFGPGNRHGSLGQWKRGDIDQLPIVMSKGCE